MLVVVVVLLHRTRGWRGVQLLLQMLRMVVRTTTVNVGFVRIPIRGWGRTSGAVGAAGIIIFDHVLFDGGHHFGAHRTDGELQQQVRMRGIPTHLTNGKFQRNCALPTLLGELENGWQKQSVVVHRGCCCVIRLVVITHNGRGHGAGSTTQPSFGSRTMFLDRSRTGERTIIGHGIRTTRGFLPCNR